ncbi:hypothetical protein F4779DRAFT_622051 [Xylariaceae sp. FL0662B]|nr:hypothetical protein F4779DRAFT_622051 [Xylariaceae sp. FL0662B]
MSSSKHTPNGVVDHSTVMAQRMKTNKVKPSEISASYFPEPGTSPSSESSETPSIDTPAVTKVQTAPTANNPLTPLERKFAKPTEELDVARQLSKKPLPWSLHSSLARAASSEQKPLIEDQQVRARKLAEAKKELLALASQA